MNQAQSTGRKDAHSGAVSQEIERQRWSWFLRVVMNVKDGADFCEILWMFRL
jgi:hypothetical protein